MKAETENQRNNAIIDKIKNITSAKNVLGESLSKKLGYGPSNPVITKAVDAIVNNEASPSANYINKHHEKIADSIIDNISKEKEKQGFFSRVISFITKIVTGRFATDKEIQGSIKSTIDAHVNIEKSQKEMAETLLKLKEREKKIVEPEVKPKIEEKKQQEIKQENPIENKVENDPALSSSSKEMPPTAPEINSEPATPVPEVVASVAVDTPNIPEDPTSLASQLKEQKEKLKAPLEQKISPQVETPIPGQSEKLEEKADSNPQYSTLKHVSDADKKYRDAPQIPNKEEYEASKKGLHHVAKEYQNLRDAPQVNSEQQAKIKEQDAIAAKLQQEELDKPQKIEDAKNNIEEAKKNIEEEKEEINAAKQKIEDAKTIIKELDPSSPFAHIRRAEEGLDKEEAAEKINESQKTIATQQKIIAEGTKKIQSLEGTIKAIEKELNSLGINLAPPQTKSPPHQSSNKEEIKAQRPTISADMLSSVTLKKSEKTEQPKVEQKKDMWSSISENISKVNFKEDAKTEDDDWDNEPVKTEAKIQEQSKPKVETIAEKKPEVKAEVKPEIKAELKVRPKEVKTEVKATVQAETTEPVKKSVKDMIHRFENKTPTPMANKMLSAHKHASLQKQTEQKPEEPQVPNALKR